MRSSISTRGMLGSGTTEKGIHGIKNAGIDSMMLDLSSFCFGSVLEAYGTDKMEYDDQMARKQFDRVIKLCDSQAIHFDTIRAPHLSWNTKRADLNVLMLQIGIDTLRSCEKIGCRNAVIQPLFSGLKGNGWQENHQYYLELGKIAKEKDICILLENQCSNINGHLMRGICADAFLASGWIDSLNGELGREVFGFCLDAGASNLCGQDMGEQATTFGTRLKAVLIRESGNVHEASRLPFTGRNEAGDSVGWGSLIMRLRKMRFNGILIVDASDTLRGFSHLLRPQLYPVIKSVSDFFQWQITMEARLERYPERVLFGAGAMCRNYMECYGEKYPPMFICDNNPKLWGTRVYGAEVRNPDELKTLPDNCAVIICNIFYEEIADQLKAMGIRFIETFNDEYVQTFER